MADLASGYNILQKLGIGARSQVFQVVHPPTGKTYALKRVIRESHEDDRFLIQAVNEYEIAKQLDHPSLRKMHEIYKLKSLFKLKEVQVVMDFVEGVSLDRKRPEALDQILDIFIQVCGGLDAMHQAGFLHTDIKPNNILITARGEVKIIDFGQSCPNGTRKPRIQGTPDYIAPEQVERRNLNSQTDIFNVGATMYWTLTGQTFPTLITKQGRQSDYEPVKKAIPTPQQLRSDVPSGVSKLVMESCAYDRSMRPRDMKAVIARLEMALHGLRQIQAGSTPAAASPDSAAEANNWEFHLNVADTESEEDLDYSAFTEAIKEADPGKSRRRAGGS